MIDKTNEDILRKVKALLAKANSTPHQEEAESFLAKAHEMMEKYQISVGDFSKDDPVSFELVYNKGRALDWQQYLWNSLADYYGCKAVYASGGGQYTILLLGRQSARITAIEMHKFLVTTCGKLGRQHATTFNISHDRGARDIGNALSSRLYRLCKERDTKRQPTTEAGRNALVTLDAVQALMKKFGVYTETTRVDQGSHSARKLAESIGLEKQVGTREGQARLS